MVGALSRALFGFLLALLISLALSHSSTAAASTTVEHGFEVETLIFDASGSADESLLPGVGAARLAESVVFEPDADVAILSLVVNASDSDSHDTESHDTESADTDSHDTDSHDPASHDAETPEADAAVRVLRDGQWGEWILIGEADDDQPDPGGDDDQASRERAATGSDQIALPPVWIGPNADQVEIRTSGGGLTVELLTPLPDAALATVPEGAAALAADKPTIVPRGAWTITPNECERGPRYASGIRAMVVHHTATTGSYAVSDVPAVLRSLLRYHTVSKGWCDLGYNFIVDRFGTIWEGREGGIDRAVIGAHTAGFNTWTSGAALLGDFRWSTPSTAAQSAMSDLVAWKLALHGVDPLGSALLYNYSTASSPQPARSWTETNTIVGHRTLVGTTCPGAAADALIAGIRTQLAAEREDGPPYDFPGHEAYEHGPGFATLDGVGGLRPAGAAGLTDAGSVEPAAAVAVDGGPDGGFRLLDDGSLAPYGIVSAIAPTVADAVDLSVRAAGDGGWVLDADGALHNFGAAPARTATDLDGQAIAVDLDDDGNGYVLTSSGLFPVGGVPAASVSGVEDPIAVAVAPGGESGWVLAAAGDVIGFGDAPSASKPTGIGTPVAILASPAGFGGWVVDDEGRVRPFDGERPIAPQSTTVGRHDTVDAALTVYKTDDSSDLIRFAHSLSALFLGEEGTPVEADILASRVTYEGRGNVVEELAHSDAWAGVFIDDLYRDVLGRSADAGGRSYWLGRLRDGTRTQDVGSYFYGSAEYVAAAGSNVDYITTLYRVLLDREPDQSGLDYWVDQLDSGLQPPMITDGFYQSPESRRGRVTTLYERILGRDPDPDGLEFWSSSLLDEDDIALAVHLASSSEYYDRATE